MSRLYFVERKWGRKKTTILASCFFFKWNVTHNVH